MLNFRKLMSALVVAAAFLFRVGILPMAVGRGRRRITATPAAT